MASNGASPRIADPENSLETIKRQLASGSGWNLLQGPLLKRSETLRKWNERWVINNVASSFTLFCFAVGCQKTPGAARAWVSTLQATQLVLKAHKEAVNSLSGNGSAKLGTVAAVVAASNSTAAESSKEIEAAMHISLRNALGMITQKPTDGPMDDFVVMKMLLILSCKVKDRKGRCYQ